MTWRRRSSGLAFSSRTISTETALTRGRRISSRNVPSKMRKVNTVMNFRRNNEKPFGVFTFGLCFSLSSFRAGLKSMVVQGVRNPLVDLLALDDKTLDEVFSSRNQSESSLPVFSLERFLCRRVMEFVHRCLRRPPQPKPSRKAVTPPSWSALTITAPWCWQQAHVKGNISFFSQLISFLLRCCLY